MLSAVTCFYLIALAFAVGGSFLAHTQRWTVGTNAWMISALLVMWGPALGRYVATTFVEPEWHPPYSLSVWGRPAYLVILLPAVIEIGVYAAAYGVAAALGRVTWHPAWSEGRVALNLAVNLPLLLALGFLTSTGEELGWRGYLQPRLEAHGVGSAFVIVGLLWGIYHLPVVLAAGYESELGRAAIPLLLINAIADSYLWAIVCTATGSLYPAIWFHVFHNLASQWLMPRLFQTTAPALVAEHGVLPVLLHVVAALAGAAVFRRL